MVARSPRYIATRPLPHTGHDNVFYRSILEDQGGNWYEAPHTGARTRQSCGLQVVDLKVKRALITQAQQLVNDYFGN